MNSIREFWDIGPHDPLPVEETWHRFVRSIGGTVIADTLSGSPTFNNADYLFADAQVVAELKEVQTEFLATRTSRAGFDALMKRLMTENSEWRPALFGGNENFPD
jgi:hypothetical protein